MFSSFFGGILGDFLAPRPNNKEEFWRLLKAELFEKALRVLHQAQPPFDVNEGDASGRTPLHFASAAGRLDLMAELLAQGARVHLADAHGNNPLHYAARNERRGAIEILLRSGADPSLPNQEGELAADLARGRGARELLLRAPSLSIFSPFGGGGGAGRGMMREREGEGKERGTLAVNLAGEFGGEGGERGGERGEGEGGGEGERKERDVQEREGRAVIESTAQGNNNSPPSLPPSTPPAFASPSQPPLPFYSPHPFPPTSPSPSATPAFPYPYPYPPSYPPFSSPPPAGPPSSFLFPPSTPSAHPLPPLDEEGEVRAGVLAAARGLSLSQFLSPEERQARYDLLRLCTEKSLSPVKLTKAKRLFSFDPDLAVCRFRDLGNYGEEGQTPLHVAGGWGNVAMLKLVLEGGEEGGAIGGASAWVRDLGGRTPLHIAAAKGRGEACAYLRGRMRAERGGRDVVGRDAPPDLAGTTPLGLAKLKGGGRPAPDVERALFERGDRSILPFSPMREGGRGGGSPRAPLALPPLSSHHPPAAPSPPSPPPVLCAVSEAGGWTGGMEDRHLLLPSLPPFPHWGGLFGVFDGHGGAFVSHSLSLLFPPLFLSLLEEERETLERAEREGEEERLSSLLSSLLSTACLRADASLSLLPRLRCELKGGGGERGEGGKANYYDGAGSTGLLALLSPLSLVVANVGDCRAVLAVERGAGEGGEEGGEGALVAVPLSRDHKPHLPSERERVEGAGLAVRRIERGEGEEAGERGGEGGEGGEGRGEGGWEIVSPLHSLRLRVSRAFGDFPFKLCPSLPPERQAVTPLPEVAVRRREGGERLLLLGCDGVWDVLTSQEAVGFLGERLGFQRGLPPPELTPSLLAEAGDDLLALCLERGSLDNLTLLLLALPPSPSLSPPSPARRDELSLPCTPLRRPRGEGEEGEGEGLSPLYAPSSSSTTAGRRGPLDYEEE